MAQSGIKYPSVFTVDTHAAYPPVPPRPSRRRRHATVVQTLLYMLVSLALCGIIIEACFIYRLYYPADSASSSKMISDGPSPPTRSPYPVIPPSKPVAHLTDAQNVHHRNPVMFWSIDADPLLYQMEYQEGKLVMQKEGYYYIYSKVFFVDSGKFHHSVKLDTPRYPGGNITLLQSRKYTQKSSKTIQSNSYLGGVFHLNKDDGIFVEVNNIAQIVRVQAYENFFGAYMI